MGSYLPNTEAEQRDMLREAGYDSFDALFSSIPASVRLSRPLDLPAGISELEARAAMEDMAAGNVRFRHVFRGAGAYSHYIPAIVKSIVAKETFLTAYTPYQAEISQGVLQSIFEYQTMISEVTGMAASNASLYDGATATAEAAAMCRDRKRSAVCISAAVNPETIDTVRTYCFGSGAAFRLVPEKDGVTDAAALAGALGDDAACLILQQPNFYGNLEDAHALGEAAHAAGAKFVMSVYPMSLPLLETPADCGADVCVGEGQPLGMPLSFGGPYLGFMAATDAMTRKLPGRIVGETTDHEGRRAFVLTLQAREQHIRREKASSNVCSNEALCAMTAAAYLSAMGPSGLREAAEQCVSKAHYLADALSSAGLALKYDAEFFNEFVTTSRVPASDILDALEARGILGGLALNDHDILWCATECNAKAEMDAAAAAVKEVTGK